MPDNIVSLADLIEQRLRKQQELDYYKETLERLQIKIGELGKEVDISCAYSIGILTMCLSICHFAFCTGSSCK